MRAAPTFEWWIVAASAVARTASADPIASAELDAAIARHAEADAIGSALAVRATALAATIHHSNVGAARMPQR